MIRKKSLFCILSTTLPALALCVLGMTLGLVQVVGAAMNAPASVTFAPYNDPWPEARERWWDISNHSQRQFDAFLGLDGYQPWSYANNPHVTLTYDKAPGTNYFVGRIDATGLKPNFAYQLKLLGKPVKGNRGWGAHGDDVANERLGYAGRWWCDSYHATQTNFDDSHYLNYYKNAPAGQEHDIYGYLFAGVLVTDKFGEAHVNFTSQCSYHITWASWQGGIQDVFAGTWTVQGGMIQSNPTVYYGYGSAPPSQTVSLWYELESGRPNPVNLAAGTYNCRFLLTEETFHNSVWSTPNGGYWKGVLATEDYSYSSSGTVLGPDTSVANDIVFTIGSTKPSITITTPTHNAVINRLPAIRGTAQSNSGIKKVDIYLRRWRNGAFEYWGYNGTSWEWSRTLRFFGATLTDPNAVNTNWARSSNLPTSANLPSGTYYIFAWASDSGGYKTRSDIHTIKVDATAPTQVTIINPAQGTTLSTLSNISGSASDNAGGSGINKVDIYLRRWRNGAFEYWGYNGTSWEWSRTLRFFGATLTDPNAVNTNWARSSNLPGGSDLPNGTYYVFVWAYDSFGYKSRSDIHTFSVQGG